MKLFRISLFLFLTTRGFAKLFTIPAVTPANPPRRLTGSVYDADRLKEDLEGAVQKYGWTVEPVAPTTFMVKAKITNKLKVATGNTKRIKRMGNK